MSVIIPRGTLEVLGPINFGQFYYQKGESDADSVKIKVKINSIRFRSNEDTPWKENLTLFDDAYIGKKKVVTKRNRTITVRLQGIDAPELHYTAQRPRSPELTPQQKKKWMNYIFRQKWGARAVYELERFLKPYVKSGVIENAYVFSKVDHPNDVFDKYGRFVGDIVISKDNRDKKNVNQWLVERGWAFPSFYNSMTGQEIKTLNTKGRKARTNLKGIWVNHSTKLVSFDPSLRLTRGKNVPRINQVTDKGSINMPKIFRRQVDYQVRKKANVTNKQSLSAYIKTQKRDKCYLTKEFLVSLAKGTKATVRHLSEFIDQNGNIRFQPNELIFQEDTSAVLRDSNGKKVTKWK